MEVDYVIGHPNREVHKTDLTDVPIIRMYGVTESGQQACQLALIWYQCCMCLSSATSDTTMASFGVLLAGKCSAGSSVCAFVHGFEPYFYVEAPPAFGPDDCDSLRALLNVRLFNPCLLPDRCGWQ